MSSSGAGSGGLFGSAGGPGKPGGNLFGSNTGSTGSASSLFGGTPNHNAAGGGSLFGGGNAAGGSGFSFGQSKSNANTSSSTPSFTSGTPAKPSSTSAAGSTTPAPNSLFGGFSTTPAGPPPSSAGLGASTGGGIFGQTAMANTSKPGFSLGNTAGSSAAPPFNTTPASSGESLFNPKSAVSSAAPASFTSFNFGAAKPAESSSAAATPSGQNNLFSQPASGTWSQQPGGLFGATPTTNASTANLFGNTSSTSRTPASQPPSGGLFSNPASKPQHDTAVQPAISFPLAAATTVSDSTPKPALFFGQGQQTQSATPAKTAGDSKPGISFGQGQQAQSTTPATSAVAPKTGLFGATPTPAPASGGVLFGQPPASSVAPAATAAATTASSSATTAFKFGAPNSTAAAAPATTAAPTTMAASSAAPAHNFPTTAASAAQFGIGNTQTGASAAIGSTTTAGAAASTSGPAPPSQSRLKNKTMDEILTRWTTDLTTYTREFKTHAETIAKWDQKIVDNSSKIDKLYVKTRTCEKQTMSVEMQLTAVENQQAELESWLSKYEADVDEMLAKESSNPPDVGGPDQEREKTYKLAEKLSDRLDEMGTDLEAMVDEVNAANAGLSKAGKADEPITQIVKILNTHLNQLQAIDQGASALQAKVAEAQKAARGIGYMGVPHSIEGIGAADDFYRSYMGRR